MLLSVKPVPPPRRSHRFCSFIFIVALIFFSLLSQTTANVVPNRSLSKNSESNGTQSDNRPLPKESQPDAKHVNAHHEENLSQQHEIPSGRHETADDSDQPFDGVPGAISPVTSIMQQLFSSMGRVTDNMLSSFSRPDVDFAPSADGKSLVARLHMAHAASDNEQMGATRRIFVAIIGNDEMRVKMEMHNEGFDTSSIQTYSLPYPVSADGFGITSAEDGTVHVKFRILTEAEREGSEQQAHDARQKDPLSDIEDLARPLLEKVMQPLVPWPVEIGTHDNMPDKDDPQLAGVGEELPSAAHVGRCKQISSTDKLIFRKCLCDIMPSPSRRAICYADLISTAISTARKMKIDGFATTTKKSAMECVDGEEEKSQCLERVASKVIQVVSDDSSEGGANYLKDKIRYALEKEEALQSDFRPASGMAVVRTLFCALLLSVCFWMGLVVAMRRGWFGNRQGGLLSQLSSVLTQRTTGSKEQGMRIGLDSVGTNPDKSRNHVMKMTSSKSNDKVC